MYPGRREKTTRFSLRTADCECGVIVISIAGKKVKEVMREREKLCSLNFEARQACGTLWDHVFFFRGDGLGNRWKEMRVRLSGYKRAGARASCGSRTLAREVPSPAFLWPRKDKSRTRTRMALSCDLISCQLPVPLPVWF